MDEATSDVDVRSTVDLYILFAGGYKRTLSIPIGECQSKSKNPLKWLRFVGFTIYGQTGNISDGEDRAEVIDYEGDIRPGPYYFHSEAEATLLDLHAMNDRTSTASSLSIRRANFRAELLNRDGTCVVTGSLDEYCDGCHLIPHAKGDQYIENLAHYRGGDENDLDLSDINDPRNGLLLNTLLHRVHVLSELAFLQTPNFALTVNDIPRASSVPFPSPIPQTLLTVHYFGLRDPMTRSAVPENSAVRLPANTDNWPPRFLFDFVYGCAVLNAWGTPEFVEWLRGETMEVYHDDREDDDDNDDNGERGNDDSDKPDGGRSNDKQSRRQENELARLNRDRQEHQMKVQQQGDDLAATQSASKQDSRRVADIMDSVMSLWKRHSQSSGHQASGIKESRDKVDAWRKSVE